MIILLLLLMPRDFACLRQIPILRVAEALGMGLRRTGSHVWNMKDAEDIRQNSSLTIFENTNTWHRFSGKDAGGVHGGSTIDLVMHIRDCSFKNAVYFLSSHSL